MKSSKYWQKRIDRIFDKNLRDREIERLYTAAFRDIEASISYIYNELNAGDITTTELYQYSRFIALKKQLKEQAKELTDKVNDLVYMSLDKAYRDVFKKSAKLIGSDMEWGVQNRKMLYACIDKSWSGEHFSRIVWKNNTNSLANKVRQSVETCLTTGLSKDVCVKQIMDRYRSGFHNADRVMRTELMHTINTGQLDTYKSAGIKRIKWLVEMDGRQCDRCASLRNKIMDINKVKSVIVHPRCRCTFIAVLDD